MPPRRFLILTALAFEARPIARTLRLRRESRTAAVGETSGGVPVRLRTIGPRAGRLPDASTIEPGTHIMLAGLAGGLADDLRRGDVVVDEAGDPVPALAARRGAITTVPRLAETPAEKRRLRDDTGALVVDMENAIVRDWARGLGLSFVGLRVVGDTAAEPLDPATLRIVDAAGRLSPGALVREIARRPSFLATLWRLRDAGVQVRTLAEAVSVVCQTE